MARTRSIRPGFFTNDSLGELPPTVRLFFAGLWTVADREGRLQDRPRKLKAELMPFDKIEINNALTKLANAGFLQRYEVDGNKFIQIVHWDRHQRPHPREEQSQIPPPEGYHEPDQGMTQAGPEPDLEPDPGTPPARAEAGLSPPGTLSSSSSSSWSSSSGPYHPLRGVDPPTPLPDETPEDDQGAPPGTTCPECEMEIDRDGEGHGLCKRRDCETGTRVHNCSLDHLAPHEWPVEVGVS